MESVAKYKEVKEKEKKNDSSYRIPADAYAVSQTAFK